VDLAVADPDKMSRDLHGMSPPHHRGKHGTTTPQKKTAAP
jgi:hypothetical protein